MSRLRIGVLGAAKIAGSFVDGVRGSERVEVVAVASRDPSRAKAFAEAHGVARAWGRYEALLEDTEVDAIYVPLPNALHAAWSIAAAGAGKHVLCEKPLALSEAEARAMFAAADEHGVALLEAFPYQFQPQTQEVERLVASDAIGEVRTMQAAFGFTMTDMANVRFDPVLGGGALLDAGCYPVSFARLVFGRRPSRVSAVARWAASGVDLTLTATLEYPGGGVAQIACSMATALHRRAFIAGSTGVIDTDYQNHTDRQTAPVLRVKHGADWTTDFVDVEVPRANGFRLEADAFADMVERVKRAKGAESGATPDRRERGGLEARRDASLDNAATLSAVLESARVGSAVEVAER